MICAVTFDGVLCERHAREKEAAVVGRSAMISYGANREALAGVYMRGQENGIILSL